MLSRQRWRSCFRCGKSRLKHVFEKSDTADYVTQFVAKTIQPSGTPFTLQARKGRNKATFKSSGNGSNGNKTLEDFGLDPRAMIKVISSTPGAVLEGARVPKARSVGSGTKSGVATGKVCNSITHSLTELNTINSKTNQQVHHVMVKELNEILRKANSTPVVIDFFATWWSLQKPLHLISNPWQRSLRMLFCENRWRQESCGSEFVNVKAFPTFQFYRNNAKVDEFSSANLNRLRATVQQLSGGGSLHHLHLHHLLLLQLRILLEQSTSSRIRWRSSRWISRFRW